MSEREPSDEVPGAEPPTGESEGAAPTDQPDDPRLDDEPGGMAPTDESEGCPSRRPGTPAATRARPSRRTVLALAPAVLGSLAGCSWGQTEGDATSATPPSETSGTDATTQGSTRPAEGSGNSRPTGDGPTATSESPTTTDPPTPTTPEPPLDVFDRIVDAVADAGCDPTGQTPCDDELERAVADRVAIRFEPGRYRFERGHGFRGLDRFGLVGEGDVSFVPPQGFNDKLVELSGNWMLFKGIDIDLSAARTTAGIRVITNQGFEVENVTFHGRGTHPDGAVTNALALAVEDDGESGTVRNVVAEQGSAIGHYKGGNGRVGIWVGRRHNGAVTIEDCQLAQFGNNGIYASRSLGTTEVVGGEYRNNNIAGVRVGSPGSSVTDVEITVDLEAYTGPMTRTSNSFNTRGIVIEQGSRDQSGTVSVADCTVRLVDAARSQGGLVVWSSGIGPSVEACRFTTVVDAVPAIVARSARDRVAASDRPLEVRDTTISGAAIDGAAVVLEGRRGTLLADLEIDQPGAERDGIRLDGGDPVAIESSSVTATRFPLVAIEPGATGDACLADIDAASRLERSTPSPAGARIQDRSANGDETCIGAPILDGLDDPPGIALTAVDDGSITWLVHEPEEEDES